MTPDSLIDQWRRALRISHRAHYEAAKHYEHLHWMLSLPTVAASAVLGTAVFSSLEESNTAWVKIAMGALSVMTVALTSLQTALRFGERSERHKTAAVQIGEVRRALEEQLVFEHREESTFVELRKRWDAADRQAPTIPSHIYDEIAALVGSLEDNHEIEPVSPPVAVPTR